MTAYTTRYALPYPQDGEAADGPVQIGALAAATETLVRSLDVGAGMSRTKANQSISTGQGNTNIVTYNAYDGTYAGFNAVDLSTGGIVIKTPGRYLIAVNNVWTANGTGVRCTNILLNGSNFNGSSDITAPATSNVVHPQSNSIVKTLAVGDVISVGVWQTSGAALTLIASRLSVDYLGAA